MDPSRFFAPLAWLEGDALTAGVTITVDNGVVTNLATEQAPPADATRLDGIMLPGQANTHSHAFHRALRGKTHAGPGDFWTWRDLMYRIADRLQPDGYRRFAAGVFAEMLRNGITAVAEFHYVHHRPDGSPYDEPNAMGGALIGAAHDAGIRLTLIDTCYLVGDVDGSPLSPQQQRFSDGSVDKWADRVRALHDLAPDNVVVGVAAHSVRAVPATDLPAVAHLAAELGAPLHVHVSEQPAENEACERVHGLTPTRLLHDAGVLGSRTTAIHATHATKADIELLAETGSGVCLCPTTERDLGDGIGPASELASAGVELSLGTDSNASTSVLGEAHALEANERLRLLRRGVHPASRLAHAATAAGMEAMGRPDLGRLEIGTPADFVVLGTEDDAMAGFDPDEGIAGVLARAHHGVVCDVFVAGDRIVSAGRHMNGISTDELDTTIRELTT